MQQFTVNMAAANVKRNDWNNDRNTRLISADIWH